MKKVLPAVLAAAVLAGCSSTSGPSSAGGSSSDPGTVKVLYAGSLTKLMDNAVLSDFHKATGGTAQGQPGGSTKLGADIKGKVKRADVFISASTGANDGLRGKANGNWESWYATFATAPLVIGYNPKSTFAAALKKGPWQRVVAKDGFRLGTTDPKLDPKGKLAAKAMKTAGVDAGKVAVFPEESLLGRLQSGQLDAGFFYSSEAAEAKIPTVPVGQPLAAKYTVTVLNRAQNKAGADAFVKYLLGKNGKQLMAQHGLESLPVKVTGDTSAVPADIRATLGQK
ncbi:MAG: extracellular solute-binding protein [Sciscionella sp.]